MQQLMQALRVPPMLLLLLLLLLGQVSLIGAGRAAAVVAAVWSGRPQHPQVQLKTAAAMMLVAALAMLLLLPHCYCSQPRLRLMSAEAAGSTCSCHSSSSSKHLLPKLLGVPAVQLQQQGPHKPARKCGCNSTTASCCCCDRGYGIQEQAAAGPAATAVTGAACTRRASKHDCCHSHPVR